ncbi:MAG: autotransporter assembly complex protein TamA, partial [Enterobacteriaceae bacterium]
MPKYPIYCLFCLLLVAPLSYAQKIKLQLEGLKGSAQQNVRLVLSTISDDEIVDVGRFQSRVDNAIRKGLQAVGYYHPTITFTLKPATAGGKTLLVAHVDQGEPVTVAAVNITLQGEAEQDGEYQRLVRRAQRYVGKTLNHADYEGIKSALTQLAWQKGYFDAVMSKSQLGIVADENKAYWDIVFDSGRRYRFGAVTFSGAQIREEYLQNLLPFRPGDNYRADQLAELNRRLSASNWFNSVLIKPDFDEARQDKVLPLTGIVTPRQHNQVSLGGGYSTGVGPRLTSTWKKPWINSRGHSLESSLILSVPEQSIDFNYKIPLLANPLEHYYLLQSGFKHEDLNDTRAESSTLNVARYWNFSSGWQRALNMRWSYDSFLQAGEQNSTMLLYPGINFNRTRKKGGLMPVWGDTQNYSVDFSDEMWGSDVSFVVLQAQNVWIRSLSKKQRAVFRANVGWMETNDFRRMPPSLRFFAGGDRSIRGYKYKSLSPKDDRGRLIGAEKMATGSIEYQYNVSGKWWGALFVDSGEAVNNFSRAELKT